MAQSQFSAAIQNLEDATWRALSNRGSDLLPFLSPDCIMLLPLGMKLTQNSEPSLRDVMTSPAFVPWKSYRMSDVVVRGVGAPDGQPPLAAIITYQADARRPVSEDEDEEAEFKAMCSSLWKFDGVGKWLMCFHQQTPFTPMDL